MHKPLTLEPPDRLKQLPPYLFAEVDRLKREQTAKGKDVVDLGVGDPDLPTAPLIVEALAEAARDPRNHRYALDAGMPAFREAIRDWFQARFHVKLDPEKEILPLIGSKEGIAHLPLAVLNPGDVVLAPDPGYPVYRSATLFAGGIVHPLPLLESGAYLPDLGAVSGEVLKKAKLLFLNYPNNPTSAVAPKAFFKDVVAWAHEHQILIAQDAAYSEVGYDGYRAPSILEIDGAREVAVEFHSLSKTFNMTGWRVGFAAGHREALRLLGKVKSNVDSGIFQAVQLAAKKALESGHDAYQASMAVYQGRRDWVVSNFKRLGWNFRPPQATFYCWLPVPPGYTSAELALMFLEQMSLIVTPGNGFGAYGEGYFRISLTVPDDRLREAVRRIEHSHRHLHSP